MLFNYTENSTFYFFSTGAQSVASIAGLSAAVAVFRYQSFLQAIAEKRTHILSLFKSQDCFKMHTPKEKVAYNKFTSDKERVEWWRGPLKDAYENQFTVEQHKWFDSKISKQCWASKPDSAKVEERARIVAEFRDNYLEFEALDTISRQAQRFKEQVVVLTAWGLALVAYGILGTLAPVMPSFNIGGQLIAKVLFLGLLTVFIYKLIKLIQQAFEA